MSLKSLLKNTFVFRKRIVFISPAIMKESRRNISMSNDPEQRAKFLAALPNIVSTMTNNNRFQMFPDAREWVEKLVTYNSTGGKKTRGLMTVYAYHMLEDPENITDESMNQAHVIGWCLELLQSCLILLDDIMDNSLTRRGQTCWYRLPDVGMRALNDSSCLLSLIFDSLKVNFSGQPYYASLANEFNEVILQLSIGQHIDCISARNYDLFTESNYNKIAIHKTIYHTYKLPIIAGLLLANKPIEDVFRNVENTIEQMGILATMQNDYMDCFGEEIVSGKVGTDIEQGKCTWLAVKALQRCNEEQRALFIENYGSAEEARVQRIKRLYEDLQLSALYQACERAAYDDIVHSLEVLPSDNAIPSALMSKLFHMVHGLWDKQISLCQ